MSASALSQTIEEASAEPLTFLTICCRIVRRDGVVVSLTMHDRDLEIDHTLYRADPAFQPSQIETQADLTADNVEITGALSANAITAEDLRAGRYDFARVTLFLVDWRMPWKGNRVLHEGRFGDVQFDGYGFTAKLRSLKSALNDQITEAFSPECRADLGDHRCRADLREFRELLVVSANLSPYEVECLPEQLLPEAFLYGRVRCIDGAAAGLTREIKAVSEDSPPRFRLDRPFSPALVVGDLVEVQAGCDKRLATCRTRFKNLLNFRGEPHVPGIDALLDYPD
ncbi:MAG: DUF2163 domain-containing protein [Pseudomonadota bacterium]